MNRRTSCESRRRREKVRRKKLLFLPDVVRRFLQSNQIF
jgi:hypothetical protein